MMAWFFKHYGGDPKNPYALPMKAASLKGLPPATIVAAEIDPLLSEGKAYADKLKKDGVPVDYKEYSGVTHEFFGMGAVCRKPRKPSSCGRRAEESLQRQVILCVI
jgi:acetyl esterase